MFFKYVSSSCLLFMIGLLSACETPQRQVRVTQANVAPLQEANILYQQGKYEAALAKYSTYVYSPFPEKEQLASARYHIGLCHYFLQEYPEAANAMSQLLKDHPSFSLTANAQEVLTKSRLKVQNEKFAQERQQVEAETQLLQLQKQLQQSPDNAALHFQLANRYWEAGEYQSAALHYEQAIQLNKSYEQNQTIRDRAYYNENNILIPRDPVKTYQDADNIIRLNHVKKDVRTRENWLGRRDTIRISGEAENRSLRTVNNIEIEVTLEDFFGNIQDTKTVRFRQLSPGQIRAFSVLMNEFSGSANDNLKVRTQVFFDE